MTGIRPLDQWEKSNIQSAEAVVLQGGRLTKDKTEVFQQWLKRGIWVFRGFGQSGMVILSCQRQCMQHWLDEKEWNGTWATEVDTNASAKRPRFNLWHYACVQLTQPPRSFKSVRNDDRIQYADSATRSWCLRVQHRGFAHPFGHRCYSFVYLPLTSAHPNDTPTLSSTIKLVTPQFIYFKCWISEFSRRLIFVDSSAAVKEAGAKTRFGSACMA